MRGVNPVDAAERKRLTRAAWSYSGLSQDELAKLVAIPYHTLKGLLRPSGAEPDADQARAIARACGVPAWFVDYGWPAEVPRDATPSDVASRMTVLEEQVTALQAGMKELVLGNLGRTRELLDLPATGRPGRRPGATR